MPNPTAGLIVGGVGTNLAAAQRAAGVQPVGLSVPAETWPQAALVREDNRETLNFASLPPEITDEASASYGVMDIRGRSEPLRFYDNTSPRRISIALEFFAHSDAFADVQAKVNWLRALSYPRYLRNVSLGPPVVHLIVGQFLQVRCIVAGAVSVTWKAPYTIPELRPQVASVGLTLEQVSRVPRGSADVRAGY